MEGWRDRWVDMKVSCNLSTQLAKLLKSMKVYFLKKREREKQTVVIIHMIVKEKLALLAHD